MFSERPGSVEKALEFLQEEVDNLIAERKADKKRIDELEKALGEIASGKTPLPAEDIAVGALCPEESAAWQTYKEESGL